jgi:hypothetical protein
MINEDVVEPDHEPEQHESHRLVLKIVPRV